MKKILVHGEYMCILNLIALPFILVFWQKENPIFWALIIFLDLAEIMLMDEKIFFKLLLDPKWKADTKRIKIYMLAVVIGYVIAGLSSWILLLILILNDSLSSLINMEIKKHTQK